MKQQILDILKSADGYISGEKISGELGISRAAVWKHIKKFKSDGYEIESITNKGYRLVSSPDIITETAIKNGLNTKFIGQNIFVYSETDSTNNRAKDEHTAPDGSLFIAEIQNHGKGRLGRGWEAPAGVGIWMSILLKPDISPSEVAQITLVAGLAVCRAVNALTTAEAKIKWPNDVVVNGKKICGILTEMSAEINRINHIVCGIGVNVNIKSFDGELAKKATSLLIETGENYRRAEIVRRILSEFETLYLDFLENGLKNILDGYKEYSATLNREVEVVYKHKTIFGKAVDIDEAGELVVETAGEKITVSSGEVSVRGIYGYV